MPKPKANEQQKIAELTADLQKIQAEFINYRRRSGEERQQLLDFAKQDLIRDLLPLLDNLGRALAHLPLELKDNPWAQGVSQVGKQVEQTLAQIGVKKIPTIGLEFDPHLHEAVSDDQSGEHTVLEELQTGYMLGDKVIRHAMVRVGKQSNQKKEK
jgi:molecular chaperone GrpE